MRRRHAQEGAAVVTVGTGVAMEEAGMEGAAAAAGTVGDGMAAGGTPGGVATTVAVDITAAATPQGLRSPVVF